MIKFRRSIMLFTSALALACGQGAYAADAASGKDADTLETVVVSGEKFGRTVMQTAASVSYVDAQAIETGALQEGRDAFERLVNVTTIADGRFAIRGVPFDNVTGAGYGALATLYVDDVRMTDKSTRYGPDMLWDVQSVEVLRGAESTLQGRNALAGTIHIKTMDPSFDWQAKARAIVSSGDGRDFAAAVSGPIIDDMLAFRLTGEKHDYNGFMTNPVLNSHKVDFADDYQFRGKLLFTPNNRLTVRLTAFYADIKRRDALSDTRVLGSDGYLPANPNLGLSTESGIAGQGSASRRVTYVNVPEFDHNRTGAGSLVADYRLSDSVTLTSETVFNNSQDYKQRDGDGGTFKYSYPSSSIVIANPYNIRGPYSGTAPVDPIQTQNQDGTIFSQELRAKYDGGPFKFLGGVYYTRERKWSDNFSVLVYRNVQPVVKATAISNGASSAIASYLASNYSNDAALYEFDRERVHVENYAVYGEAEYTLFDRLTFTGGLRYDFERNSSGVDTNGAVYGLADAAAMAKVSPLLGALTSGINSALNPFSTASSTATKNYSALLPKFAVRYAIDDNLTVGAVVQRAYRAGGVSVNVVRQLQTDLKPEYTTNYEGFARATFLEGRGHLEANVYLVDWKNQQVTVDLSTRQSDQIGANAGKSRLYGTEIQAGYDVTDEFNLYGGLGYSHAQFLDFHISLPASVTSLGISVASNALSNMDGKFFAAAPEWSSVLGLNWHNADGYFGNINTNFQGVSYATTANTAKNSARTLVNLRFGREFERFRLSLFANNLLNEYYITDNSNTARPALGQPRVYGATLDVHL